MRSRSSKPIMDAIAVNHTKLVEALTTTATLTEIVPTNAAKAAIEELAKVIEPVIFKDGEVPVILTLLNGGSHFTSYLTEQFTDKPFEQAYMHMSRYGDKQTGSEEVKFIAKPSIPLEGKTVVICDDIIEGGLTIKQAKAYCQKAGAKDVIVVTFGDKPQKRIEGCKYVKPDFTCFYFGNAWLAGIGLDAKHGYGREKFSIFKFPDTGESTKAQADIPDVIRAPARRLTP